MAGDWLKIECCTPDKPEIWAVGEKLGLDPDAVLGKLIRVWIWFDQQTEDGNAPIVTKSLLDRSVGVTGFCDSIIECGWMIQEGGFIRLHNFDRHNGKTAKNRALTAKRVSLHKAKGNDKVTTKALPREEKRREDNNSLSLIKITPDLAIHNDILSSVAETAMVPEAFAFEASVGFIGHFLGREFTREKLVGELVKWIAREWEYRKK